MWDITSRQLVARPDSSGSAAVAFSPGGTRLAATDYGRLYEGYQRIGLWDTRTGRQVDLLSLKKGLAVQDYAALIEFDRRGTLLLTVVTDDLANDRIELINGYSGTLLATFQVGPNELFGDLSFSPDGTILSSLRNIYGGSTTNWWDVKTASLVYQRATDNLDIYWLPESSTAFFLVPGGFVIPRLWRVTRGREQFIVVPTNNATYGTFDPVHNRLALSYYDSPIRVLDAQTGNKLFSVPLLNATTIFTPDGKYLVAAGSDKEKTPQVMIIDAGTGKQQAAITMPAMYGDITSAAFDPGGKLMALNDTDNGVVLLIDIQTGKTLRTMKSQERFGAILKFNGDSSKMVYIGPNRVQLWDVQTGNLLAELARPRDSDDPTPDQVDFSSDGKRAVLLDERTVRLHDAETGDQLGKLVVSNKQPAARFSPDGTRLIVTHNNVIQVWDAQSGNRLLEWNTPDKLTIWQFSPDGSILITATISGIVQLWNPATGQQLVELKGHHAQLWSIVFSPDRSLLATSSDDSTVRLWGLDKLLPDFAHLGG